MLTIHIPAFMTGLKDITLYEHETTRFPNGELGRRDFRYLVNYVSDLYVRCLHDYKPPKTSRVSICLSPDNKAQRTLKFGSIAIIDQYFPAEKYNELSEDTKARYVLNFIHNVMLYLSQVYEWDTAVFENAYQEVIARNLKFCFEYPFKASPDHKKRAQLIIEKTQWITTVFARVELTDAILKVKLYEHANRWWYDSAYAVAKHGKWLDKNRFGIDANSANFKVWYSLQDEKVFMEKS